MPGLGPEDRDPYRPIPRYEHPLGPRQPIALRLLIIGVVVGAAFAAALSLPAPVARVQIMQEHR